MLHGKRRGIPKQWMHLLKNAAPFPAPSFILLIPQRKAKHDDDAAEKGDEKQKEPIHIPGLSATHPTRSIKKRKKKGPAR